MKNQPKVTALAGGVGGAKLVLGLSRILPKHHLNIVVNTGDDDKLNGLRVSPDIDTITYTLAGIANVSTGWGIQTDTFYSASHLKLFYEHSWFTFGDKDLATNIKRTDLLNSGYSLTESTKIISKALKVSSNIIPMSDSIIQTVIKTKTGNDLSFQEYFVKNRSQPAITGIQYKNIETSVPNPEFIQALNNSRALIICPSNPYLSIGPIINMKGIIDQIRIFNGTRIAISPIIGDKALKGPAAKILKELGSDSSCYAVAKYYKELIDIFVIDEIDSKYAPLISDLGMKVIVLPIIMKSLHDKITLAKNIMSALPNK